MVDKGAIRHAVRSAAPKYKVQSVSLFGSYARGDFDESSDVDLMLDTSEGFSLLDAAAFRCEIMDALGLGVDVVSRRALSGPVREAALRDEVVIYERA